MTDNRYLEIEPYDHRVPDVSDGNLIYRKAPDVRPARGGISIRPRLGS